MNPVVWFEIAVNDMEAARAFYQNVFEIEMPVTEMGDNLMAWFPDNQESPGVSGSLVKGEGYVPSMEGSMVSGAWKPMVAEPSSPNRTWVNMAFLPLLKTTRETEWPCILQTNAVIEGLRDIVPGGHLYPTALFLSLFF